MKIGIDIRCLVNNKHSGVEEYTSHVLQSLFASDLKNEYILFYNAFFRCHIDLSHFTQYQNVTIKRFYFPNKILNFFLWLFKYPHLDRLLGGVDFFYMPNINFAAFSSHAKLFLTVHDLSFELYPQTFSLKRRLWHFFVNPRQLMQRADRIISVSRSTKSDVHTHYKIPIAQIIINKNGYIPCREEMLLSYNIRKRYHLPEKYILYFGTIEPRKNLSTLINAYEHFRDLCPHFSDIKLVLAGGIGWKSRIIFDQIKKSRYGGDIHVTGFVTLCDKAFIYTRAVVFVYPSVYEGFGLPLLEAMGASVPIITSHSSSLPEVVGRAALMVDVSRPKDITSALVLLLTDRSLYSELSHRGSVQTHFFNWRDHSRTLQNLFNYL